MFEERPTKLKIPDSSHIGGDMDGMGDLNNAPMPPMDADNIGGDMPMDDPNSMGTDPMNSDPNSMDNSNNFDSEDDELMNIINSLSIEDKAAVTKYAKSMIDDSSGTEGQDMGDEMPMESRKGFKNIIDEVINDVLDNGDSIKRPAKKLPRQYRDIEMPFVSPL